MSNQSAEALSAVSDQRVTTPIANQIEVVSTPFGEMMTRKSAGKYLKDRYGFGTASMLARAAMDGTGPPFRKVPALRKTLYPVAGLDDWALAQFSEPRTSHKPEAA